MNVWFLKIKRGSGIIMDEISDGEINTTRVHTLYFYKYIS